MIALLLLIIAILFVMVVWALTGWWVATDRIVFLDAVIDALKTETWTSGELQ